MNNKKCCSKCKKNKNIQDFYVYKKTGQAWGCCKSCNYQKYKEYYKNYAIKNKEKIKQNRLAYIQNNKEEFRQRTNEYRREYVKKNKSKITNYQKKYYSIRKEYFKEYYLKNKEKIANRNKIWSSKNREKCSERQRIRYQNMKIKIFRGEEDVKKRNKFRRLRPLKAKKNA